MREFDNIGRPTKETLVNTGAYTRYEYPTNGVQSKVYTTITDTNGNNTGDLADEVLSESWADGAGRTRKTRTELPNSLGGYSGSLVEYNILGQVKRSTVPTEINSSWQASGDDANRGFLWMQHEYDWKGRPTKETNTDGTFKSFSYSGCGCAGGQVTTIEGEQLAEGRRTQKVYADILGRTFKTETLNWDGTVYSSSTTTFDGADRPIFARQFKGSAFLNNPHQTTMMTYDGFGRLKTEHRPEQDNGTATTYNYLPDGRMQNMIDARGATTNYGYIQSGQNIGQLSQVGYSVPSGSTIPITPTVTYVYDNLGNRTSMTDGVGNVNYVYNSLGQMTSETRQFNDALPNSPSGGFKLEYDYTMNGQLKSLKDPYGQQINYGFDKIGRLNNVVGSTPFQGITSYASTPIYNARGVLTHLNYGNGVETNITNFNNKLQATNFEVKKGTTNIIKKNYEFYDDGSLKYSQDLKDARFDRLYKYDFVGQIKEAKTGLEARGGTVPPLDVETQIPYRQSYNYNVYGELTERNNLHWGRDMLSGESFNLSYTYQNGRITDPRYLYDADGRGLNSVEGNGSSSKYDASGNMTRIYSIEESDINRTYDGNGREGKRSMLRWIEGVQPNPNAGTWSSEVKTYFIRSSILGNEVVTQVDQTGKKQKTIVRAGGSELATQGVRQGVNNTQYETLRFRHTDASRASIRSTESNGTEVAETDNENSAAELDALGGNVGLSTPYIEVNPNPPSPDVIPSWDYLYEENPMYVNGRRVVTTLDGLAIDSKLWHNLINSGRIGGQLGLLQMRADAARPRLIAVGLNTGDEGILTGGAGDEAEFRDIARIHNYTLYRFFVVNDNWSFGAALSGTQQEQITGQEQIKAILDRMRNRSVETTSQKIKNQKTAERKLLDERLFKSYAATFTILSQSSGSCATWFGKNGVRALEELINKATIGVVNVDGKSSQFVGIQQSNNPNGGYDYSENNATIFTIYDNVTINSQGPFLNSSSRASRNGFGNYPHAGLTSQILQILHEVAHLVYRGGKPLIPVDGGGVLASDGKKLLSEENTETVLFYCRDEINEINQLANSK